MEMDWGADPPFEGQSRWDFTDVTPLSTSEQRLDTLLPSDPATGTVSHEALKTYLSTMMEMVGRHHLPLSLLRVGVDPSPALDRLGPEGKPLIASAVARCLQQETRPYDVVGLSEDVEASGVPAFFVVCPLMGETQAARLAERLLHKMILPLAPDSATWLTFSIGVAAMALDAPDAGALLARTFSEQRTARQEGGGVWRHSDTKRRIAGENSPFPSPDSEE